jgi:hypothetical protein
MPHQRGSADLARPGSAQRRQDLEARLGLGLRRGLRHGDRAWSRLSIIKDGLIYVVDLRNGLYLLKYDGRFEREVDRIDFLEGNSNQGDALCFEPVGRRPRYCH